MGVRIRGLWLLGWVLAVTTVGRAGTVGWITEVLTGPHDTAAGTLSAYIEVSLPGPGNYELVILDATTTIRQWNVYALIPLSGASGTVQVVASSSATWPADLPGPAAVLDTLPLTLARSIVLYSGATGLSVGTKANVAGPLSSQVLDAVTIAFDGFEASQDFPVKNQSFSLDTGDALLRQHDGTSYTDAFSTGPLLEGSLTFESDGQTLNPGLVNAFTSVNQTLGTQSEPDAVPEPGSIAAAVCAAGCAATRPRRRA